MDLWPHPGASNQSPNPSSGPQAPLLCDMEMTCFLCLRTSARTCTELKLGRQNEEGRILLKRLTIFMSWTFLLFECKTTERLWRRFRSRWKEEDGNNLSVAMYRHHACAAGGVMARAGGRAPPVVEQQQKKGQPWGFKDRMRRQHLTWVQPQERSSKWQWILKNLNL